MNQLIATWPRRLGWSLLGFGLILVGALWFTRHAAPAAAQSLTDGELLMRFLGYPTISALALFGLLTACSTAPAPSAAPAAALPVEDSAKPFVAQVVGVQWLNPLQRRDYPTEWQLLWTLGLAKPNQGDDKVKENPKKYSTLQMIGMVAYGNDGRESLEGYHQKYVNALITKFHDIYFSSSRYFYNAHSLKDKTTWRELAGIHVQYALPQGRLDPVTAADFTRETIIAAFDIGNPNFPKAWSRSTPPDVHVTMG
ncbi:virulence factor, partial [Janthinobacterium sp. FW305-129]|nr:virulence factor [Janthinobacterium sp. FW305-129]